MLSPKFQRQLVGPSANKCQSWSNVATKQPSPRKMPWCSALDRKSKNWLPRLPRINWLTSKRMMVSLSRNCHRSSRWLILKRETLKVKQCETMNLAATFKQQWRRGLNHEMSLISHTKTCKSWIRRLTKWLKKRSLTGLTILFYRKC